MKKEGKSLVNSRIPGGNASRVRFVSGEMPEIRFSVEPKNSRPLWFHFQVRAQSDQPDPSGKLKVVLEHYETLAGAKEPDECSPVFQVEGQWWMRMGPGKIERSEDGRVSASWLINDPAADYEIALCFPYEDSNLKQLVRKKDGIWTQDTIGLSSGGRSLIRMTNGYKRGSRYSGGLYVVARERGCDMPASWLLDGLLQRLTGAKNNPFLTWAVPVADPDASRTGAWRSEPDLHRNWMHADPRHEVDVIRRDLALWRERCQPSLGLSIAAADLSETSGIFCEVPNEEPFKDQALKWARVIQQKLGKDFASPDFIRTADTAFNFHDYVSRTENIPGLTIRVPWGRCGDTVLSPKKYRDAGRHVADALIEKRK